MSNNINYLKYRRSFLGKIKVTYRAICGRIRSKNPKHTKYTGLKCLEKEVFIEWSKNNINYLNLWNIWVDNNYKISISPSIDRTDPKKGYTLDNIQWITHSENSSKAVRKLAFNKKDVIDIRNKYIKGNMSFRSLGRMYNCDKGSIIKVVRYLGCYKYI